MGVLASPEVQLRLTVPPALLETTAMSRDMEVRLKLPPVEDERVMTTLVAFTSTVSAVEFVTIEKSTAGEARETVVLEL